jgi:hypothetical protein
MVKLLRDEFDHLICGFEAVSAPVLRSLSLLCYVRCHVLEHAD